MFELRTRGEVGLARVSTASANPESRHASVGRAIFRIAAARVVTAGGLLALAGCSAHLVDSVKTRLPAPAQQVLTPEVTEAIRSQANATLQELTPAAVDRLGAVAFRLQMARVRTSTNAYLSQRVERVRARLVAAATGTPYADAARAYAWEVRVIEDDDVNAFALPGGKIGVNTGLLKFTKEDDALLAVALGHELIHAMARHAAQRISQDLAQQLEFAATGLDLEHQGMSPEVTAGLLVAMGITYEGTAMIPFVREQELEADREGLLLMARAGYDPHAAISFWETRAQQAAKRSALSQFLATHPPDSVRITQLHQCLVAAVEEYRQAPAAAAVAGRKHS
jgi:predicted Zn-dependent protease